MAIVTDGLVAYWHNDQGVNGNTWGNIAPGTSGSYDGTLYGAVSQANGMFFDGVDDYAELPLPTEVDSKGTSFTLEYQIMGDNLDAYPTWFTGAHYAYIGAWDAGVEFFKESDESIVTIYPAYSTLSNDVYYTIAITYDSATYDIKFYVDGSEVYSNNFGFPIYIGYYNIEHWKIADGAYKGHYKSMRVYDRALSPAEVSSNHNNGLAVGLPSNPPSVDTLSLDANKISDEPTKDTATVTFTFDQDVTEWRVRVLGTSPDSGFLADSGGSVSAGTEINAVIDYTELQQEGSNRLNIYGRNSSGQWTQYSN